MSDQVPRINPTHTVETRSETSEDASTERASWKALFTFTARTHLPVLASAIFVCVADGVIQPVQAIFIGRIYNAFTDFGGSLTGPNYFRETVSHNVLTMFGLSLAGCFLNAVFLSLWIGFGELQARSARLHLFHGLLGKPMTFFDTLPSGVGSLSPRIQTQIRELQLATAQPLGSIVLSLVSAIASTTIAFNSSWSLTLILLGTMPINAFIISYISNHMQKHVDSQVGQLEVAAKHSANAFINIETVKCFNGQRTEYDRFMAPVKRAASLYVRQVRGNALQMGWMMFATFVTFLGGFYYGSSIIRSGKASTADFITTFFSCLEVANAIKEVLPQMIVLEKGRAAGRALNALVVEHGIANRDTSPDLDVPRDAPSRITFAKVSFAYPTRPDDLVLRDVTFSFAMGETSFVIGRSGSGKSTLPQLLLKLYSPQDGDILLDRTSVTQLDTTWIRKNITLVEQQGSLFSGTIFENISVAAEHPERMSFEDVKSATEFALLSKTLADMPCGLDTIVGPKGASVSGGQRQRISLARARLRDTPILILDESTSALDQTSRSLMMAAIRQWRRNKTTIIISHDISQIEATDFVHMFEDGRLIVSGYRLALEGSQNQAFARYVPSKPRPTGYSERESGLRTPPSNGSPPTPFPGSDKTSPLTGLLTRTARHMSFVSTMYARGAVVDIKVFSPDIHAQSTVPPLFNIPVWRRSVYGASPALGPRPEPILPLIPTSESRSPRSSGRWSGIGSPSIPAYTRSEVQMMESFGSQAIQSRETARKRRRFSARTEMVSQDLELAVLDSIAAKYQGNHRGSRSVSSLRSILRTVWPYLDSNMRRLLVLSFACLLIHSASIPIFSWTFSKLIATFYMTESGAREALKWSLVVLALSFVDGAATYFCHIGLERCSQSWVDAVRLRAMERILDQPKEFFEKEDNSPPQLAFALDRNAEEMRNILGRFVSFFVCALVMLMIAAIWSLVICWKLALIGFSLTPLSWLLIRAFQVVSGKLESQSNDASEIVSEILNETLTNIKTVRIYTLEPLFTNKHNTAVVRALAIGIKRSISPGFFFGLSQSCMSSINCLIYYYGAVLVSSRDYSVVDVVFVFGQITFALANVSSFLEMIPQISSSKDTAMRLLNLANLPQNSHEHRGVHRAFGNGDITFDNVTFAYPSRPYDPALKHINLSLIRGRTTAIVGGSGSGKSTIASLLLRLYAARSTIKINDKPLTSMSASSLREHIAIVPQTPVLFPTTVSENIAYGLPNGHAFNNAYSIRSAAAAAGIADFLASLPQGYNTIIGDGGMGFSGGQTQRLAIARALIRNPGVLILDEATSALDVENSALIRETVRKLIRDRPEMCIIAITHERQMMELADRVVMLAQGRVVEEGRFDDLMERDGKLSRLLNGGVWAGHDEEEISLENVLKDPFVDPDDDRGEWSDVDV